jgi:hypothetical protein
LLIPLTAAEKPPGDVELTSPKTPTALPSKELVEPRIAGTVPDVALLATDRTATPPVAEVLPEYGKGNMLEGVPHATPVPSYKSACPFCAPTELIFCVVTEELASFAVVTALFARSTAAMVASRIFALVTEPSAIVGFGYEPVRSPPAVPPGGNVTPPASFDCVTAPS